ncbi:MAG TPA: hypothetical protein VG826_31035 [Pirellulales bacterium]|nr:hypothetical protein [Pirellulales bacterium]
MNHPAFTGWTLMPGKALVEIEEEFDRQKGEVDASTKAAVP